ncbi:MAG: IS30 family transposase [Anaerolineales bacterium]|jgi:IS30 family transposase
MSKYTHLTTDERLSICQGIQEGRSLADMARGLGRSKSTLSRELRRNGTGLGYLPDLAQRRYRQRRQACRPRPKLGERALRRYVILSLERGWSPEVIAGRLSRDHGPARVSHETIYRFIYLSPLGRQEKLWEYLRRGKKRRSHPHGRQAQKTPIPNRVFIDQRPSEAQERSQPGHWETDSLLYPRGQALNVLVDRMSRYALVTKLEDKTAEATARALCQRLASWPARTITADNGSEHANHALVSQQLGVSFYFCHAYHSWEKGTVEQTNGLLRRYLPRHTDLRRLSQEELDQIADELNQRPRKCLQFSTPKEVLFPHAVALRNRI